MATTDPLTSATIQDQSDAATGGTQIGNVVKNLRSFVVTRFSTTGARDTAYTSFVSGGGTMADGMLTAVGSTHYRRISGTWRINRNRHILRSITPSAPANSIAAAGASETGITSGAAALTSFTLYEACTVLVSAEFRAGNSTYGVAAATCSVKINGSVVGNSAVSRDDSTCVVVGAVALAAGTHTIALRVDSSGGTSGWTNAQVVVSEGIAE